MGVGAGLYMYDVVVKKFTFAISSPDEFLSISACYLTTFLKNRNVGNFVRLWTANKCV